MLDWPGSPLTMASPKTSWKASRTAPTAISLSEVTTMSTSPPDSGQTQTWWRLADGFSCQKAVRKKLRLTDVWSHARIQSGNHGLHRVLGFVKDRLHDMVTCYSLGTHKSFDCKYQPLFTAWRACVTFSLTLKKPQIPPPLLTSADTLGSSCSSGKVIGDPETSPADMTGCWLRGFDTTPERHSRGGAEGWVDALAMTFYCCYSRIT